MEPSNETEHSQRIQNAIRQALIDCELSPTLANICIQNGGNNIEVSVFIAQGGGFSWNGTIDKTRFEQSLQASMAHLRAWL